MGKYLEDLYEYGDAGSVVREAEVEIDRLTKQRDELVKVLEKLPDHPATDSEYAAFCTLVYDALASVKGGA